MLDLDNGSEFTTIYFRISVYEVKTHNRADSSADVSASSLAQVQLTPLEIENGTALFANEWSCSVGCTQTHIRTQTFPIHGIYIPMQALCEIF